MGSEMCIRDSGGTATEMHKKSGVPADVVEGYSLRSAEQVAKKLITAIDSNTNFSSDSVANYLVSILGHRLSGLVTRIAK